MKQLFFYLLSLFSMPTFGQNVVFSDVNGDGKVTIGDVTHTINASKEGAKFSRENIDGVAQAAICKRNALILWLKTGEEIIHFFEDEPTIKFMDDYVVISTPPLDWWIIGDEGREYKYKSSEIIKITYDFITKVHEGQIDNIEDILG